MPPLPTLRAVTVPAAIVVILVLLAIGAVS